MPVIALPLDRSPPASFPHVPLSPELWHRRFGHIGIDATRAVLTKQYATGIQYIGPFTHTHCIPCLIGKHPQRPYDHFAQHASKICELLHMDTCGPFPSDAASSYYGVEAEWEHQSGNTVMVVRSDGAGEFVDGELGTHFRSRGIIHQITAPYAHSQNGKMERYIRTLEETALTLLADSGLPMSFWGDAVKTDNIFNRLPTSTLPATTTPFEVMKKVKPDLSHLRVWGASVLSFILPKLVQKGVRKDLKPFLLGMKRVGLDGGILLPGYCLQRECSWPFSHSSTSIIPPTASHPPSPTPPAPPRPQRNIIPTVLGRDWTDAIRQRDEHLAKLRSTRSGGVHPQQTLAAITDFSSLLAANDLALPNSDNFLSQEVDTVMEYKALVAHPDPHAMSRPDAEVWRAAMKREHDSLQERGVFQPTTLPKGRKAIGVRWVYDFKLNPDGSIIRGKRKARLVAQGFNQRPEDYGNTYAPVAKLTSIRIVLAYAALHDLELMCCDVKTAFLNALLSHEVYCKQVPGFPEADPSLVYLVLRALYVCLEEIGLIRCEVDHAVFYGRFSSPPDASISMPTDGSTSSSSCPFMSTIALAPQTPSLYIIGFLVK
ncbi:hypothetical protein Hypma_014224 [Hypsizygus marmoreus]|uniref:Integrase catalytic domain-containing protein n=1 Tax=Hypsizygus marmoreus TaxID=39966 RepID=A0A369JD80_HYPMA|nr:hypothetical protein Hypma_014224 [Hypsizygus marmoreus]